MSPLLSAMVAIALLGIGVGMTAEHQARTAAQVRREQMRDAIGEARMALRGYLQRVGNRVFFGGGCRLDAAVAGERLAGRRFALVAGALGLPSWVSSRHAAAMRDCAPKRDSKGAMHFCLFVAPRSGGGAVASTLLDADYLVLDVLQQAVDLQSGRLLSCEQAHAFGAAAVRTTVVARWAKRRAEATDEGQWTEVRQYVRP